METEIINKYGMHFVITKILIKNKYDSNEYDAN